MKYKYHVVEVKNKQNGFQTKLSQYFKNYNLPLLGFGFCYSKLLKLKRLIEGCIRYLQIWKSIENSTYLYCLPLPVLMVLEHLDLPLTCMTFTIRLTARLGWAEYLYFVYREGKSMASCEFFQRFSWCFKRIRQNIC